MPTIHYLVLEQDFIWLESCQDRWQLPSPHSLHVPVNLHQHTFFHQGAQIICVDPSLTLPDHFKRFHLRDSIGWLGIEWFHVIGKAKQWLEWQQTHRFCGRCGHATLSADHDKARQCPHCQLLAYPRIAPCVLIGVYRAKEILLARSPHFPSGVYSVLAGFVEGGETAEQCCQRETQEEVGIEIHSPQYFGSQPWPFPHQLMLAYQAEYSHGELRLDPQEIEDAQWFRWDRLPPLPSPHSLSYQLIQHLRQSQQL